MKILHVFMGCILVRERPLMTSHVFWPFLTYLLTLSYSITSDFGGYLGPPLPTLISDVINGRSLSTTSQSPIQRATGKTSAQWGTEFFFVTIYLLLGLTVLAATKRACSRSFFLLPAGS